MADIWKLHFGGFLAWLVWIFVHIFFLIGFRNRVLVLLQWAWSYLTYSRGARLITGETPRRADGAAAGRDAGPTAVITGRASSRRGPRELGFLACGITDPARRPTPTGSIAWLAKGYAGTMRYLHRQAKRGRTPGINVPEALAVVVVLENYYSPGRRGRISRRRGSRSTPGARTITGSPWRRLDQLASFSASAAPRWRTPTPTPARCPSASWPSAPASAGSARTPC